MSNYKEQHEDFVSNLEGSHVLDLIACLAHVPLLVLLAKVLQKGKAPKFLQDVIVLSLPLLVIMTVWADYNFLSLAFIFGSVMALRWKAHGKIDSSPGRSMFSAEELIVRKQLENPQHTRTNYLSLSKGATVLFTCIAILAVDFQIFPRRFGKTETFGVSLMDYGVGAFMISTASTSRYARGLVSGGFREACSLKRFIVLILGVGRLLSVKLLNYQEHLSEYGIHWNFFVTLFCVWTVADILHGNCSRKVNLGVSIFVLIIYQMALSGTGLTNYLFSPSRFNLFDDNKEGIVSLLGYIPLFLITEEVSFFVFYSEDNQSKTFEVMPCPNDSESNFNASSQSVAEKVAGAHNPIAAIASNGNKFVNSDHSNDSYSAINKPFVKRLSSLSIVFWGLWLVSNLNFQPTSRRLCNLTYIFLSLAISFTLILFTYLADVLGGQSVPMISLHLMCRHSLVVFLISNMLTGVVNMIVPTIHLNGLLSLLILALYTFAVTLIPWVTEYINLVYSPAVTSK